MNNKAKGFTLIELMISLVLGSVILGAVLYIFLSNSQTYRMNEAQSRVQENGRFALELLTREIRHAGFNPTMEFCGGSGPKNEDYSEDSLEILPDQMRILADWSRPADAATINEIMKPFRDKISGSSVNKRGTADLDAKATALNPVAGSDVLQIRKQNSIRSLRWHPITAHSASSFETANPQLLNDQIKEVNENIDRELIKNAELKNILIALDEDCTRGTVFSGQIAGGEVTYPNATINGNSGNKSTREMGLNYEGGKLIIAAELTEASKVSLVRYFIAQPAGADIPSLYRQYNDNDPQALIEGVSALTIDIVTGSASPSNTGVTVNLNIMSQIGGFAESTQADGRLQQVFETTVAVRNRI